MYIYCSNSYLCIDGLLEFKAGKPKYAHAAIKPKLRGFRHALHELAHVKLHAQNNVGEQRVQNAKQIIAYMCRNCHGGMPPEKCFVCNVVSDLEMTPGIPPCVSNRGAKTFRRLRMPPRIDKRLFQVSTCSRQLFTFDELLLLNSADLKAKLPFYEHTQFSLETFIANYELVIANSKSKSIAGSALLAATADISEPKSCIIKAATSIAGNTAQKTYQQIIEEQEFEQKVSRIKTQPVSRYDEIVGEIINQYEHKNQEFLD